MSGLEGRSVCVLGLGRSGEAAARALLDAGASVVVLDAVDTDAQRRRAVGIDGARVILGRTDPDDVAGAHVVIASPGVPWSSAWIERARAQDVPVWSEVELAFRLGVRPLVAITGTNGKTTTTEMAAAALRAAGRDVIAAGNVGTPLVSLAPGTDVVAELSSFQLQSIDEFRAPIAALLNVGHDHLDWHGSDEAYRRAKARIFENVRADDIALVHDDETCRALATGTRARTLLFSEHAVPPGGAGIEAGWIVVPQGRVVDTARLRVAGRPNRADAVAAAAIACALGAEVGVVGDALARFEPRPHRIERLGEIDGVAYINDSKATDPHATLAALEDLNDVILIAGGRSKSIDLGELAQAAPRLRAVIAMGEAAPEIDAVFGPTGVPVDKAGSMEEAVARAQEIARPGDTVLLSPACASLDMYTSYEHRGEAFRAAVQRMRTDPGKEGDR
ncbi:MAG: UDP-N-acetylmuramoyl-L-alanine--D-glutamate ligase [Actinomycetota bacterium]